MTSQGSPSSPIPVGLHIPDVIVTRRTRTMSMNGRIEDEIRKGTVKFFCRSKGHGFIDDDEKATDDHPLFMHISDIEGEYIPRKGDRVSYRSCPMPPRFDRPQAVQIQIIDFTPERHHRWCDKETPQELAEDLAAINEEKKMNASLHLTPPHRRISTSSLDSPQTIPEAPNEAMAS